MKTYYLKSLLIPLCLFLIISATGCVSPENKIPKPFDLTSNISGLDRGTMLHGEFVLGTGSIDSNPVYFYYEHNKNGGYKLQWVSAKSSIIFEDENASPYIRTYYSLSTGGFNGISGETGKNGDEYVSRYQTSDPNYIGKVYHLYHRDGDTEIHIPPNSIRKEFAP